MSKPKNFETQRKRGSGGINCANRIAGFLVAPSLYFD
jgi:hypothetical protein